MQIKLKIDRQVAEDMQATVIPHIIQILQSRCITEKDTRAEVGIRVCKSVMHELHQDFKKRIVNSTKSKIVFKFREYEALILYDTMLRLPIDGNDYWRNNYRNLILNQLDVVINSPMV